MKDVYDIEKMLAQSAARMHDEQILIRRAVAIIAAGQEPDVGEIEADIGPEPNLGRTSPAMSTPGE